LWWRGVVVAAHLMLEAVGLAVLELAQAYP
jgi:hypothetical protein